MVSGIAMHHFGMSTLVIIVDLLVSSSSMVHLEEECPLLNNYQCICYEDEDDINVFCQYLHESELKEVISSFKGYLIGNFEVQDSSLGVVPGDIWEGTYIQKIKISNTSLTSFGDEKVPSFSGLMNSLTELHFEKVKLKMPFLRLGHLKLLEELHLIDMKIPKLRNDWFKGRLDNLRTLEIQNCRVKYVSYNAFSHLENLEYFIFQGNFVTLRRGTLPVKALYLEEISIRNNRIREIPRDFFDDLPVLHEVDLKRNDLTNILQKTWGSIAPQLGPIPISSNPLVCDSKLKWIIINSEDAEFKGKCHKPENLKGRALSSLKLEELE